MMEVKIILDGLDCANCASKIERKIEKLKGIQDVSVNFAMKQLYFTCEKSQRDRLIQESIDLVKLLEPDVVCQLKMTKAHNKEHKHGDSCCHNHHEEEKHECGCGHDHHDDHEDKVIQSDLKINVKGLDCANCAEKIEKEVKKLKGVEDAVVNFSMGTLQIKLAQGSVEQPIYEKVVTLIKKIEPDVSVSLFKKDEVIDEKDASHRNEIIRLICGLVIFGIAMVLKEESYAVYIFLVAFVISGGTVVVRALKNVLRKEMMDENFLMSIATIGAFAIGDYGEGVAVMLFYEVGELFQSFAVNRSRKSIKSLMAIRSDVATLYMDGFEKEVASDSVKVGDTIILKPGERVPLDGILLSESTTLDTSALTGESLPRDVETGGDVLAGAINLNKVVQVKVTKILAESSVSRILDLVQNAGNRKAPMEKFITKFAHYYTPIVVCMAIALVLIPTLLGYGEFNEWLYRGLTFLVVSCPCALVVSIPLGLFAGIGGASRRGILVKGGNYLEALKDIDTVVFDKTGTLTKGIFKVVEIHGEHPDELLEIAAHGESSSTHPIARSIVKEYGKEINRSRMKDLEEISGKGIKVLIDEEEILLGNAKWMSEHQINFEELHKPGTIVYIAKQNMYLGFIRIADEIKETSKAAIQALKASGVKRTIMLSGDQQLAAEAVKDELGIDEVYAQLLPQDKVSKLEDLLNQQSSKGKLAFVGDGINDAPVIARADIGFAMGGIGSDAAIEAADVVLMKDDPMAIVEAIRISKNTKRILIQNIVFSLGIKVGVLLLVAFGYADMWLGVFADVGVTLLAIINSMRALRYH